MDIDAGWDEATATRRVADAYLARFGEQPVGVWSAPGRVNLIGEHTDYNGGLCLPLALRHRTYVALGLTSDGMIDLASTATPQPWRAPPADAAPGRVAGWAAYPAGVLWALAQTHSRTFGGIRAVFDSCVPVGSGLSSSAAIQCALAVALDDVAGLGLGGHDEGRTQLGTACVRAAHEVAGARPGGMDQAASLLGEADHALFLDMRDGTHRLVPFATEEHRLTLLVIDTRVAHAHAGGEYARRRGECEAAARALGVTTLREIAPADLDGALASLNSGVALGTAGNPDHGSMLAGDVARRRVRHVVTEIKRVRAFAKALDAGALAGCPEHPGAPSPLSCAAQFPTPTTPAAQSPELHDPVGYPATPQPPAPNALPHGDLVELGRLMTASHASLREDFEVSCPELDLAVTAAIDAGSLGARMTGGGFGGCAIALIPTTHLASVVAAVTDAFSAAHLAAPRFLDGTACGPARRDWLLS
jgi:galactokinase